jgi:hypothetical protein
MFLDYHYDAVTWEGRLAGPRMKMEMTTAKGRVKGEEKHTY